MFVAARLPLSTGTHLTNFDRVEARLMPRAATMNGDRGSMATAPLDLSTSQRGGSGCVAAGECLGAPPSPADTPRTLSAGRRPADEASLRLPFRKRPIALEPEERTRTSRVAGRLRRLSPARGAGMPAPESASGGLGNTSEWGPQGVAVVTPTQAEEAARRDPAGPICFLPSLAYSPCSVFCLNPEVNHHGFHPTQDLLASLTLAKRQDEDGDTALHIAVVQGEMALVCQLIHLMLWAGKTLDIYNNLRQTPLHLAVITWQVHMVDALLRAGADPSALDRNGQTALHLCCEYNHRDCLSVLLSLPASSACLEIKNYEGLSPLHLAVIRNLPDLSTMLLGAGADINTMDIKSGKSPLVLAVESNNAEMVHFLIESGCDVNRPSYSGNTALHCACGRAQADMVRLLLKNGADSSLKNYYNDTPVMVAKNKKIADILRGRGSRLIRLQEQPISTSPHRSNGTQNLSSPSQSHSRGCSPGTRQHAAPNSPQTPPTMAFPF
ncbi:B-cell lymphoma 3 protein homolog isoform X2 [Nerophis ophidion]|uniref:B-cell lymphoma 3 protein homolog isoform X2 n=1 Tax=Nerophis ophidion TaxID=159077 RepID=UPI002AE088C5|nr:B-cell lymphoma 3 protein homolog isoform X2 [Nerophis ophidion]